MSNFEPFIEQCTNDEGDRHVLACAIKIRASVIVTFNVRHFEASALAPWALRVVSPDEYLLMLYERGGFLLERQLVRIADKKGMRISTFLERLRRDWPKFAKQMLARFE